MKVGGLTNVEVAALKALLEEIVQANLQKISVKGFEFVVELEEEEREKPCWHSMARPL